MSRAKPASAESLPRGLEAKSSASATPGRRRRRAAVALCSAGREGGALCAASVRCGYSTAGSEAKEPLGTSACRTSENAVHAKFVEFALSTSRAKTVPGLFYLAFVAILVIPGQG